MQPHSQGLSSSHPLSLQECERMRDPGNDELLMFYLSNFLDVGENLMNSPSLREHRTKSYRES